MKTIIRLFAACLLCACSFSLSAQQKEIPQSLIGKWSYTFEDPQTGQPSSGFCIIKQEGENTVAVFETDYGTATTTPFRPNNNGKFYADMELQGYPIYVAFKRTETAVSCDMTADSFEFTVQMKRVE
jgi:hypothetical protein